MEEDYYWHYLKAMQKQFKVSVQEWAFIGYNKTSRCLESIFEKDHLIHVFL